MPRLTKEQRAESRAICNAATPGEWWERPLASGEIAIKSSHNGDVVLSPVIYPDEDNIVFIAHARTALPAALDDLEEMEADHNHWKARAEDAEQKNLHWNEAEEQGRLMALPCKVGTNVKKCHSCAWSGVHSLKTYGVWRCDYHGFYADGSIPDNIHCEEWRKDNTAPHQT